MLDKVFLIAAIVGGTVMVCQFLLTILGLGHHGDGLGDVHGGDFAGGHADGLDAHSGDAAHAAAHDAHHDGAGRSIGDWLFGVITLRTVVAALAFFGLTGKAMLAAGKPAGTSLGMAVAAGAAAMYGVYALMRAIYGFQSDGTFRIRSSLGQRGTVYIPIPAARQAAGKIQLKVQGRLVELAAMTTHGERLPTGTVVEVMEIIAPRTVLVAPVVADVPAQGADALRGPHQTTIQNLSAGTDVGT